MHFWETYSPYWGENINMARPSTFLESRSCWGHDCGKQTNVQPGKANYVQRPIITCPLSNFQTFLRPCSVLSPVRHATECIWSYCVCVKYVVCNDRSNHNGRRCSHYCCCTSVAALAIKDAIISLSHSVTNKEEINLGLTFCNPQPSKRGKLVFTIARAATLVQQQ